MLDRCGEMRVGPLRSRSLILEPLRVDHAVEMAPLLDDPALHTFIGGGPASLDELRQRYARQVVGRSSDGSQQWLNWIVRRRDTGIAVGTVQATVSTVTKEASPSQRVAEVAWVIAREHQHRGHGREAALTMAVWLRTHGVDALIAHIHPDHHGSAQIARALGLAPTGDVVDGEIRWQG